MSAPIIYVTGTPINDNYVFTGKKYAISNGRPGLTGFINYRNNPNGRTWHPAYKYDQYHPNGTGYYIISNTRVQGGHATAGNEIPTFQVTGNTDNEIINLINRLPLDGFYTNIEDAKNSIINDPEYLQFDADLLKYAYYAPQFLKLNFDFGNLNCDIKKVGSAVDVYNFTSNFSGFTSNIGDDYFFDVNDNSSFYRKINTSPLGIYSGFESLECTGGEDFVIAVCVKLVDTINSQKILIINNDNWLLYNQSTNKFEFRSFSDIVTTTNPVSTTGVITHFHTIIFGRCINRNEIFIYVNDENNNSEYNVINSTTTFTTIFNNSNDFFIGDNFGGSGFYLGILQYWKDFELINTADSPPTMLNVSQPDFTTEIYNLYSSRWN
jgi:hypothetical protein